MRHAFAIKYRPKNLDEVIGNSAVKKVLKKMFTSGQFNHLLLEGLTGSGKTTLAYIVAKAFGADPKTIDDVNCVHFSSVNDMREKLTYLQSSSFFTKRVLILDEIHRLSAQSQDVMLKPLEEGLPDDVLVIACTTTTEKLSPMLLDRFKRLKVMPLDDTEALALIKVVEDGENIAIPKWKKGLIVEKCDGVPRRILSGLDKISSVQDEKEAAFLLDLNSYDNESSPDLLELFKLLLAGQPWKSIFSKIIKSTSPEGVRVGLCNIIGARLMSAYGSEKEKDKLADAYLHFLDKPLCYPEKAALISVIYQFSKHFSLKSKGETS